MDREYPKILPDPQSCSMQTYGMEQGTLVMEGSKDTILPNVHTHTGNKFKEASTPGHVFGEPPVYTVALKTGPRKHTWNG